MIARRNVLDLIGMHRGKYHSCILTCYSLDFSFFEERVLPTFRSANIKNVNVFADGKFLELAQDATTGDEFKFNKTYNFHPVYTTGVFHPKTLLLLGVRHGLLVIGSGNITSSGLSTNDEIWGAFHLNNINNENSFLFWEVWNYLQQFVSKTYGFIPQKIEWIRKYSPWLEDLPRSEGESYMESLNQYISFVSNSPGKSTYQHLVEKIPSDNLDTLTIISPYFDHEGQLLENLNNHFKPNQLNCIVDAEYGLLPHDLDLKINSGINFYEWSTCVKDFHQEVNRLHAKIFHFYFADGSEYMLLGSANATNAAMGTSESNPINHEAGIIIRRTSSTKTWLEELQINLSKTTINNYLRSKNKTTARESVIRTRFKDKVLYAELRGNQLSVYVKNELDDPDGRIVIYSRDSVEIDILAYEIKDKRLIANCNNPEDIFKINLVDGSDNIISNYCIVHRVEALIKCNPDPQQEKLDGLLEQDYPDGEGISELLQYVDYNWADEEYKNRTNYTSGSGATHKTKIDSSVNKYEKLSPEEFNKISDEMFLKQTGEMSHPSVKIADFLSIIGSELAKPSDDFTESEEQRLLEDNEQEGEGSAVTPSNKRKINAIKERNAIHCYFRKLDEQYLNFLQPFYKSKALTVTPQIPINIKALSNILIALQLIQMKHGKKFEVDVDTGDKKEKQFRQEKYFIDGDVYSGNKTIKGFMVEVFGKFLLLCTGGVKEYEYDMLNQKINHYRKQVFEKAIFTILNVYWSEHELDYRDNLLLNTMYFLNDEPVNKELSGKLKKNLISQRTNAKYVSFFFDDNLTYFLNSFLPKYIIWQTLFTDKKSREELIENTSDLYEETAIFNSKIGFNIIHKTNHDFYSPVLSLKRAGYEYHHELKQFLWCDITYGKKSVKYSAF